MPCIFFQHIWCYQTRTVWAKIQQNDIFVIVLHNVHLETIHRIRPLKHRLCKEMIRHGSNSSFLITEIVLFYSCPLNSIKPVGLNRIWDPPFNQRNNTCVNLFHFLESCQVPVTYFFSNNAGELRVISLRRNRTKGPAGTGPSSKTQPPLTHHQQVANSLQKQQQKP